MKLLARPDIEVTYCGGRPTDETDPEGANLAVELTLPTAFSPKAWKCWDYFNDRWLTAVLYYYQGKLVVTDEALELSEPRWECDTWEELEKTLEVTYDDLEEEGLFPVLSTAAPTRPPT